MKFYTITRRTPTYRVTTPATRQSIEVNTESERAELLQLLVTKSVCVGEFTLVSGRRSDLYVDAKQTTTDPRGAILIGRLGASLLKRTAADLGVHVDTIGGLTMGADALAGAIGIFTHLEDPASKLQTFIVRKTVKAHGRQKLIEGNFSAGDSVVVLDDVITTGGSTLQAIDAIEGAGGRVAFVVVLVDRQEGGREAIEARGYRVVPFFTRADLLGANGDRPPHTAAA